MDTGRISGRYAKAAYEFASETGEETRLYEEMKMLVDNFEKFREMKNILDSPAVSTDDKIKILTTAAGINVSKSFQGLLTLLTKNKRESYVLPIALMYGEYYRKNKGMIITQLIIPQVETISEETKIKLKEIITREEHKQVDFITEIDETLIGGFILKLDDFQLDASIKTQLSRLKQQLTEGNNVN